MPTSKKLRLSLVASPGLMLGVACAHGAGMDQLQARSAFDLNCPGQAIQIQPIDERTMGVVGCGRRVTYVESCNPPKGYAGSQCTWVMNSDMQQPGPVALPPAQPQPMPGLAASATPVQPGTPAPGAPQVVPVTQVAPVQSPPGYYVAMQARPPELEYHMGAPIPSGYRLEEYHSNGLVISGAVTLSALYAISVTAAFDQKLESGYAWLAVPIIGPFGWLGARKSPACAAFSTSSCESDENNKKTLVLIDGLGQVAGAALLTAGLAVTRRRLVLMSGQEMMMLAPHASSHGAGLSLVGRF